MHPDLAFLPGFPPGSPVLQGMAQRGFSSGSGAAFTVPPAGNACAVQAGGWAPLHRPQRQAPAEGSRCCPPTHTWHGTVRVLSPPDRATETCSRRVEGDRASLASACKADFGDT